MQKYFISIESKNNLTLIANFLITILKLTLILCLIIGILYVGFYLLLFLIVFFSVSYIMNSIKKL